MTEKWIVEAPTLITVKEVWKQGIPDIQRINILDAEIRVLEQKNQLLALTLANFPASPLEVEAPYQDH